MRYVNTYEQRWYRDDSPFAQICAEGFFILTTGKGTKYEKKICRRNPDFVVADHGVNRCPSTVGRAAGSTVFRKGRISDRSL